MQSARDFAITRFAHDLVESVDNLDRALGTVPQDKLGHIDSNNELVSLYEGLKMTETILMQTLKKHGLERFDPSEAGEQFNPNLHEATFQTAVDGKEDGSVFMTQQKGFMLNGRVIRVNTAPLLSLFFTVMALTVMIGCKGWRGKEQLSNCNHRCLSSISYIPFDTY